MERTVQPILCAICPVNQCGDSQILHLLDEASERKAGRENCPLLWAEGRAAAATPAAFHPAPPLPSAEGLEGVEKVVERTTQQKQPKKA